MHLVQSANKQSSNFELKNRYVGLQAPTSRIAKSVSELEALRAEATAVPASKYGLEVICGASCEIGAQ